MNAMRDGVKGWLIAGLLLGTAVYALAEDITLTTYYPSPRGVYDELRTSGDVKIGDSSSLEVEQAALSEVGEELQALLGREDVEREIVAPGQEVAVFCDQGLSAGPFGVGGNERVGRFEAFPFILGPWLKGDKGVFIDGGQRMDEADAFPKLLRRQVDSDFFHDGPADADRVGGTLCCELRQQGA